MRTVACVFCVMLTWSISGCGPQTSPTRVRMLDYGLYDGTAEVRLADEGQPAEVLSIKLKGQPEATTTIPCQPDTLFGFRLDPATLPQRCHLRLEYEHPEFTPSGKTLEVDEYDVESRDQFDGEIIYCFVDAAPHEIVPGKWTFRVLMDGQKVAEKTFQVVK